MLASKLIKGQNFSHKDPLFRYIIEALVALCCPVQVFLFMTVASVFVVIRHITYKFKQLFNIVCVEMLKRIMPAS